MRKHNKALLWRAACALLVTMFTATTTWATTKTVTYAFYNMDGSSGKGTLKATGDVTKDYSLTITQQNGGRQASFAISPAADISLAWSSSETFFYCAKYSNGMGYIGAIKGNARWTLTISSTNYYITNVKCYNTQKEMKVERDNDSKTCALTLTEFMLGSGNYAFSLHAFTVTLSDTPPVYTYNISYELNGGTNAAGNPSTYDKGTGVASLANPTRTGYIFDGWYDNPSFSGTAITSISTTATGDVTLYAKWTTDPGYISGAGTASDPYVISSKEQWDTFANADNYATYYASDKHIQLGADVSGVTTRVGTESHKFSGTFDGNHRKLTFNATATDNHLAPFRNVLGNSETDHAVISNLNVVANLTAKDYRHTAGLIAVMWGYVDVTGYNVTANISCTTGTNNPNDLYPAGLVSQVAKSALLTVSGCTVGGTIATDGKYAAGMVGIVQGSASILNSVSSVTINSSRSGDGTHGGFVAAQSNTLTIEGCLFNGSILSSGTGSNATTCCGGFVGWKGGTVNITNSLFTPTSVNITDNDSYTFSRRGGTKITNCYYTQAFGSADATQGGEAIVYSPVSADFVPAIVGSATGTTYGVSGITVYESGLKREGKFYFAKPAVALVGDVDGNYMVDKADLTALMDYLLGKTTGVANGDVNGDTKIDIADVAKLVGILKK